MLFEQGMALGGFQIAGDHLGAHLLRCDLRHPAEVFLGLGGIAQQGLDLGGAEVPFVDANEEGPAGDEDADEWIDEPTD